LVSAHSQPSLSGAPTQVGVVAPGEKLLFQRYLLTDPGYHGEYGYHWGSQ
jgi:hypothetical protein